jgi:hypothetical protein
MQRDGRTSVLELHDTEPHSEGQAMVAVSVRRPARSFVPISVAIGMPAARLSAAAGAQLLWSRGAPARRAEGILLVAGLAAPYGRAVSQTLRSCRWGRGR